MKCIRCQEKTSQGHPLCEQCKKEHIIYMGEDRRYNLLNQQDLKPEELDEYFLEGW